MRRRGDIQREGEFIHGLARWRLWTTVTFTKPVSQTHARTTLQRWLQALARDAGAHVVTVFAIDPHASGDPHIHALLGEIVERVELDAARAAWLLWQVDPLAGLSKMDPYDPDRGAAWYLAGKAEWDRYVGCPRRPRCRRRSGCLLDPHAW